MNFVLNLITFLLIVVGLIMVLGTMPSNRKNTLDKMKYDSQTDDIKLIMYNKIVGLYVKGVYSVILGFGIIIARIFS